MSRTSIARRNDRPSHRPPAVDEAVGLLLRAVAAGTTAGGLPDGAAFLLRRASGSVEALPPGRERSLALRILDGFDPPADSGPAPADCDAASATGCGGIDAGALATSLLALAGHLEVSALLEEAGRAVSLARKVAGERADLDLHAGRIARKRGDRESARRAYARARRGAEGDESLARMAAVGEALLDERPAVALGRVLREAVRAGDPEAAGVALEERARVRREKGDVAGALRDLGKAAIRYPDPADRARLTHARAELLAAQGDPWSAREAFITALDLGRPGQRARARGRLHDLSRELGDDLGRRRWRPCPTHPAPGA